MTPEADQTRGRTEGYPRAIGRTCSYLPTPPKSAAQPSPSDRPSSLRHSSAICAWRAAHQWLVLLLSVAHQWLISGSSVAHQWLISGSSGAISGTHLLLAVGRDVDLVGRVILDVLGRELLGALEHTCMQ